MKKILCALLSLCFLLTLAACGGKEALPTEPESIAATTPAETTAATEKQPETETIEPVAEPEKLRPLALEKTLNTYFEWADELPDALVRSEHSAVTLAPEETMRYPEMARVLEQIAAMQEKAMLEEFDNLVVMAGEELAGNRTGFSTYTSLLDVQVRRADSLVISLLSDSYSHYGQIEFYRVFHGTNYDTRTGRELLLNEVVNVNNDLALAVEKELLEQMYAEDFHTEYAVQNYFADTPYDGFSWTLDYNGVTFYFEPGQFCEGGAMAATVTFAEYPELFEEAYMAVPEQYSVELPMDISFFTDLNGDGDLEAISVSGCYDNERNRYLDYGVYTNLDGCWYEECFVSDFHPYYMKTAEGHYLYLFCEDFQEGMRQMELIVFRLNVDGSVTKCGEMNVSPAWLADNRFLVPTDPAGMMLDDLDTGAEKTEFTVANDGIPQR